MLPKFHLLLLPLRLLLAVTHPGGQVGCSNQPFLGKNLEEVSAQSISHLVKRVPLGGTFRRPRYLKLGSTGWLVKDVGPSDSTVANSLQKKISKVVRILRQGATVRVRQALERIVRKRNTGGVGHQPAAVKKTGETEQLQMPKPCFTRMPMIAYLVHLRQGHKNQKE